MITMNKRAEKILNFWFKESTPEDWFKENENFDKKIKNLFLHDYTKAVNNEYDAWQDNPKNCLALIIILDQFSRNLFRNSPKAFEQDYKTRLIVNEAIDRGYLEELDENKNMFLLLPLIHSENLSDHIFGHQLIRTYLNKHKNYKQIKKVWTDHTIPIKKYGRYPHRNKVLGRQSTTEEKKFLNKKNSSW